MSKGRKIGSTEVSVDEMSKIIELTERGTDRKEIARQMNRSHDTVWRYQKNLDLI